jgi:hypothetical protein
MIGPKARSTQGVKIQVSASASRGEKSATSVTRQPNPVDSTVRPGRIAQPLLVVAVAPEVPAHDAQNRERDDDRTNDDELGRLVAARGEERHHAAETAGTGLRPVTPALS